MQPLSGAIALASAVCMLAVRLNKLLLSSRELGCLKRKKMDKKGWETRVSTPSDTSTNRFCVAVLNKLTAVSTNGH